MRSECTTHLFASVHPASDGPNPTISISTRCEKADAYISIPPMELCPSLYPARNSARVCNKSIGESSVSAVYSSLYSKDLEEGLLSEFFTTLYIRRNEAFKASCLVFRPGFSCRRVVPRPLRPCTISSTPPPRPLSCHEEKIERPLPATPMLNSHTPKEHTVPEYLLIINDWCPSSIARRSENPAALDFRSMGIDRKVLFLQ